jgi:Bifunctional DNA primase/polymerase, N-terminal/AAA domain
VTTTDTLELAAEAARIRDAVTQVARLFHVFPVDHPAVPYCDGLKTKEHDPFKCNERGKHPTCKWSRWSTQFPDKLGGSHYFGSDRPHNIGIDCAKSSILVVDEDAEGEWDRFCADRGVDVPVTFTVRTAKGRHFYFRQPEDLELGNQEGALRGYKLNVRGISGYVLGPGSRHETGVIYKIAKPLVDPIFVPGWLIKALTGRGPASNGDSPFADPTPPPKDNEWWREGPINEGDRHNAIVAAAGWCHRMGLRINEARPLIRDVWSRCQGDKSTWEQAAARLEDVYRRYENGDRLEERRSGDDTLNSWNEVDLTAALRGDKTRSHPTILRRSDGRYLFYEGQVNYLHGADGVGKSYVALFGCKDVLDNGGHVVWLDWEDPDEVTIIGRLSDLGVTADVILERFHYLNPQSEATPAAVAQVCDLVRRHQARLVVVDSVREAFGVDGVNEDRDNEVGPWMRRVLRPLAATGAGVLPVDHGIKSGDNPLFASGSKRKRAAVTGAHYLVEAPRPLSKEYSGGQIALKTAKDRHGNYTRGKVAGIIDVAIYPDGGWTVHIHPPAAAAAEDGSANDLALVRAMVRVVKDIEAEIGGPVSQTMAEQSKRVKGGVQAKRAALQYAAALGCLDESTGPKRARLFSYVKDVET